MWIKPLQTATCMTQPLLQNNLSCYIYKTTPK